MDIIDIDNKASHCVLTTGMFKHNNSRRAFTVMSSNAVFNELYVLLLSSKRG